jgi:predicted enzyme related to lactoylglutathione lyase
MANDNQGSVENGIARHGKLSYMQIPAPGGTDDTERTAQFYATVFGWTLSGDSNHRSFSDATGELIGAFVPHLAVANEPGVLPYVYVSAPIEDTVAKIEANGGTIARAPYDEGGLRVATFHDPAGNTFGIWSS